MPLSTKAQNDTDTRNQHLLVALLYAVDGQFLRAGIMFSDNAHYYAHEARRAKELLQTQRMTFVVNSLFGELKIAENLFCE